MYTVRIMNEYLHGPIWVYGPNGIVQRHFALIDNDPILHELDTRGEELYSSYYDFDEDEQSCTFAEDSYRADKAEMLDIITKIKKRLDEINDGSFVVEDYETEGLLHL